MAINLEDDMPDLTDIGQQSYYSIVERRQTRMQKKLMRIEEGVITLAEWILMHLPQDVANLSSKERVNFFLKLNNYVMPKLASKSYNIDVNQLTDEQVDMLLAKIVNE